MILAVDIGNTNIVFGGMTDNDIVFTARIATDRSKTGDEYAVILQSLLALNGIDVADIEGGILSSVVPPLKTPMADAVKRVTGKDCLIVGAGIRTGLNIRIDNPAQLGSDRVADAVAAIAQYPLPLVIFDMGTATTFSVVDKNGMYLGGMIMPGAMIGLDALTARTSQLPQISLSDPPKAVIGTNTVDCMKNGMIFGNAAMLDGIVTRIGEELGETPTVIATGGMSGVITPYCRCKVHHDPHLLLKGLRIIYKKNI